MMRSRAGHAVLDTGSMLLAFVALVTGVCGQQPGDSAVDRIQQAKQALEYVERIASSGNCSGGTGNKLQLSFDTSAWITFTDPAIRTANFLSQILASHNNKLDSLADSMFYDFVRNNVHGDTLIFGSAVAIESDVHSTYATFCPYASKVASGGVSAFDLATAYNYSTTDTEWYNEVKIKDFSGVHIVNDTIDDGTAILLMRQPVANYSHGRWTFPYFDCGGGNIWMVTYSAPILALGPSDTAVFKGVATIDLELTNIDINQCDAEDGDAGGSLDVFRGTHNCQPTTRCVPVAQQGFRRGSYNCECRDGFYFPDTTAIIRAFNGSVIDNFFDNNGPDVETDSFRCFRCPRGCDTCVDATPCLYEYVPAIRILVVLIIALLICGCGVLSFFTHKYRKQMVMKTASPIFLQIMIGSAVLMCTSVFVMYPEPTDALCTIFVWPFHMGFALLYGSLLIKTWRISVIFNSRKKVNLPDKVLLQRLVPLPAVMAIFLSCWTVIGPPQVITVTMDDTKKFFSCSLDYWTYAVYGVEALLLLFGVYLCFTVRKAPAHFNESKHITWSTYNAIILGIFIITLTQFLSQTAGPDVVYVLLMMQLHVFVTFTLALIFVPKFWALHKGTGLDGSGGATSVTGRPVKAGPSAGIPTSTNTGYSTDVRHVAVQVNTDELMPPAVPTTLTIPDHATPNRPSPALRTNKVAPLTPPSVPHLPPLPLHPLTPPPIPAAEDPESGPVLQLTEDQTDDGNSQNDQDPPPILQLQDERGKQEDGEGTTDTETV